MIQSDTGGKKHIHYKYNPWCAYTNVNPKQNEKLSSSPPHLQAQLVMLVLTNREAEEGSIESMRMPCINSRLEVSNKLGRAWLSFATPYL